MFTVYICSLVGFRDISMFFLQGSPQVVLQLIETRAIRTHDIPWFKVRGVYLMRSWDDREVTARSPCSLHLLMTCEGYDSEDHLMVHQCFIPFKLVQAASKQRRSRLARWIWSFCRHLFLRDSASRNAVRSDLLQCAIHFCNHLRQWSGRNHSYFEDTHGTIWNYFLRNHIGPMVGVSLILTSWHEAKICAYMCIFQHLCIHFES